MKSLTLTLIICSLGALASAQTQTGGTSVNTSLTTNASSTAPKLPELDSSPMDMSYFPAEYPILKTQNKVTTPPVARIIYGRPQKNDRVVFGELVEYNKVWRMGANEATEIEFFKDVTIGGKKVAKGRYTLYAIPEEKSWTIIVNKDTDTWGAFVYNQSKDVVRTKVNVTQLATPVEPFSMAFTKTSTGANLVIAWEKISVALPIEFK